MSHTVIGIFESTNQAQEAKSYLLANGYSDANVDISNGGSAGYTGTAGTNHEEGVGSRIGSFFSNLFEDEDDATAHTVAAHKGSIVTIHAQTEEEALQAVRILDNYGAVDVNEYAEKEQ